MPMPEGMKGCPTCGLPYQLGRKAAHDLKASHRAAAMKLGDTTGERQVRRTVTVTDDAPPAENFGQRQARLRKERKAHDEQAKPAAHTGADAQAAANERAAGRARRPTAAEKRAAAADARADSGKRPATPAG